MPMPTFWLKRSHINEAGTWLVFRRSARRCSARPARAKRWRCSAAMYKPQRTAPILADQRDAPQIQRLHQRQQFVVVHVKAVVVHVGVLVGPCRSRPCPARPRDARQPKAESAYDRGSSRSARRAGRGRHHHPRLHRHSACAYRRFAGNAVQSRSPASCQSDGLACAGWSCQAPGKRKQVIRKLYHRENLCRREPPARPIQPPSIPPSSRAEARRTPTPPQSPRRVGRRQGEPQPPSVPPVESGGGKARATGSPYSVHLGKL